MEVQRPFGRESVAAIVAESPYAEAAGAAAAHIDAENGAETAAFAIDKYVGRNRTGC